MPSAAAVLLCKSALLVSVPPLLMFSVPEMMQPIALTAVAVVTVSATAGQVICWARIRGAYSPAQTVTAIIAIVQGAGEGQSHEADA